MDQAVNCGGCCGEIEVFSPDFDELTDDAKKCTSFERTMLFHAQYYEYKISHFIDKSFESFTGMISVLPGAFSMFRWEAMKGKPLKKFF